MNNKEDSDYQENHNRDCLQMPPQVDGLLLCAGNGERNASHESEPNEGSVSGDP